MEQNILDKSKTLNPHAAEFVPSALRASSVGSNLHEPLKTDVSENPGRSLVNQKDAIISTNSDEEVIQYWRRQLPDDITPDFKFIAGDEQPGPSDILVAGLSLLDGDMPTMNCQQLLNKSQEIASQGVINPSSNNNLLFYIPECGEEQSSSAFMTLPTNPWGKQLMNYDEHLSKGMEKHASSDGCSTVFLNELSSEQMSLDDSVAVHVELMAKEFPGFAAESLAEVYYANGCDLSLTIEMLTQLELQVDSGFSGNISSKALSAPNLSSLDFPALTVADAQNGPPKYAGDDLVQAVNPCISNERESFRKSILFGTSKSATNFASAVRKVSPSESGNLKYVKNGSTDVSIGTSRGSQLRATSCAGSQYQNGDRLLNCGTTRGAPVWLETGDAVANMYSELREEARDHARLRNAYFDQARQAYIIGNKALAKELSMKGQLHNVHMKAAHGKARESIFRQRNPSASNPQGYTKANDRMIDLHGLHVSEALHVLKRELSILRTAARSGSQRLQVYICVGTGHHTKGSRTPARLPAAVEKYLLEEEHLEFGEPQPGLLRVVIY
ncbi:polyadenylate-binding protein-interacting protein 7-like isoform X1 [Nymphaea colorata]|nr:polyadenylate-binding protein-interacting protein 7-like isoform X1 [Nymphaea colorata]XP_031499053.1 polyadenylate-binding protein-interacting protein 7-like isoform X1 [Nymphaea colorata]XP_031499055.1 polyadenylate-binding protein-interacting protein 7-like isoform X1 [Nymphaea colorata]XP_031499057.1 polyadenylate-binding protein-interacting protein 7-like isoform X1 [Nymphaea colorata]XP_031499058.1 polyadenylate-binding protein-interacting protein 7-like isoform X1 [Nymphaea colorata]